MNKEITNILQNIKAPNTLYFNTKLEGWYLQSPSAKGCTGEAVCASQLRSQGCLVEPADHKSYDLKIDGKKVEVKTAFKKPTDNFLVYGYEPTSKPHYWILQLVTPDYIRGYKLDRKNFSQLYLHSSRKNTMLSFTEQDLIDADATLLYEEIV